MSEKIKACPCGLNGAYVSKWVDSSLDRKIFQNVAQVRCSCGWRGPERYGDNAEKEAIDVWNRRVHEGVDNIKEIKKKCRKALRIIDNPSNEKKMWIVDVRTLLQEAIADQIKGGGE